MKDIKAVFHRLLIAVVITGSPVILTGCYYTSVSAEDYPDVLNEPIELADITTLWVNSVLGEQYKFYDDGSLSQAQVEESGEVTETGKDTWRFCLNNYYLEPWDCSDSYSQGLWIEVDEISADLVFTMRNGVPSFFSHNGDHAPGDEDFFVKT